MSSNTSNTLRVIAGVFLLFVAFILGALLCGQLLPDSPLVNKMETANDKMGASIGIFVAALLFRRYLLRSFKLAMACLVITEVVVFLIILMVTGLAPVTWFDIAFNLGWLYSLTWNVVVAYVAGALLGYVLDKRAA